MNKRRFLSAVVAASATASTNLFAATAPARRNSPVLLTITGRIGTTNRGGFDPAADILMGKHGVTFDRGFAVDYAALARLPRRGFKATLEYDDRAHVLDGPLLTDVLRLAGVRSTDSTILGMRAVDGYAPTLTMADARRYAYIVALHKDGAPLPLGGLGPLWAVYEADRFPEMATKPVNQRFASCPWAMYHIDVGET